MIKLAITYGWRVLVLLACPIIVMAQADKDSIPSKDPYYKIGSINVTGNKKTRDYIIYRELPFRAGEQYTIQTLTKKFEDAQEQLMNTSLFHSVEILIKTIDSAVVNISVKVRERWYFFPGPFFKPVDRNLNQWLVEQKASLSRVNYGIKFIYYNATGHNDKLKGSFGTGYTKQFSMGYDRPYFDRNLQWGYSLGFSFSKNKEVNYNTINDKQVFVKDDDIFLSNFANFYTTISYRRKIKTKHSLGLAYTSGEVSDTVLSLNPSYFKSGRQHIRYPDITYSLYYFDVDFIPYPRKGYAAQFSFSKKGMDHTVNVWQMNFQGSGYWPLTKKTFINSSVYAGIKVPFKQPYYYQHFLGFGDTYMQGYEYYVIDGVAGGYLKTALNYEFLKFKVRMPPLKKGKEPLQVPFRFVAKTYGNMGYVHNPQPGTNLLSNKMLYSGGFGLDIITFYDIVIKLEYSFNQLGENGLFLHRKSVF